MKQLNKLEDFETEMDRFQKIHQDIVRLRQDIREHEDLATLRWIITLAAVCTAWYFRGV